MLGKSGLSTRLDRRQRRNRMRNCHGLPAHVASVVGSLFMSFVFVAACGERTQADPFIGETGSLAWCTSDAGCGADTGSETTDEATDWLIRCTSDSECAIGQCVCGLCSEACNADDASACSAVPEGAACFGGGTTARAALCHASTVPGICLPPCDAGDDCGEGYICALGACLPDPKGG
jgi:hypothetical protein